MDFLHVFNLKMQGGGSQFSNIIHQKKSPCVIQTRDLQMGSKTHSATEMHKKYWPHELCYNAFKSPWCDELS